MTIKYENLHTKGNVEDYMTGLSDHSYLNFLKLGVFSENSREGVLGSFPWMSNIIGVSAEYARHSLAAAVHF